MKKRILSLVLMATVAATILAGCGSNSDSSFSSLPDESPSTSIDNTSNTKDVTDVKTAATLEDYYNQPEVKAQYDAEIAQLNSSTTIYVCEVLVDGNKMTYSYTYDEANSANFSKVTQEQIDAAFAPGMEQYKDTFQSEANTLLAKSGADSVELVIAYYSFDGKLLYAKSFFGQ